ncbi:AAA family ATPase [bacterium]|nr:AAA family ATPase [bacterium]
MSILNGLNPRQKEAVLHKEGPLLILAGAGSGKTRVITYRIAQLIENRVKAENLLGVTFTNKAANEMRERVRKLVGQPAQKVTLSTFHSLGLRILRKHAPHIGYRKDFSVYSEGDQLSLVRMLIREHPKKNEKFDAGILLNRISDYKNKCLDGKQDYPLHNDKYDEVFADMYFAYQQALKAFQAVDFDDLIVLPLRLFREHPDVLQQYQSWYKYIMVDEYQDTNHGQFLLISKLASRHGNLCAVGDDDQSIYGWRGAEIRNILEFQKDFPKCKIIKLEQNYRSTQVILDAAYEVIKNNNKRQEKRMWTDRGRGLNIDAFIGKDEEDEAKTIAHRLEVIKQRSQARWTDFAVLYRSNVQSRALEAALRIAQIPYKVYGGYAFFERKEVRDLVAYLKVILNPNDDLNLLRIINYPRRGIGNNTIMGLTEEAQAKKTSIFNTLRMKLEDASLSRQARGGMRALINLVDHLHEKRQTDQVAHLVRETVEMSGYREEIQRTIDDPISMQMKIEMVEELASAAANFEIHTEQPLLQNFIDTVALGDEPGDNDKNKKGPDDAVTLTTLHSAKGLEFPFVFLCGLEEDLLPHARSVVDNTQVDEERRLCYVGMTRAQRHLTLSLTGERTKFGKKKKRTPSRFLKEIPEALMCKQFSHSEFFFNKQQR